MSGKKAVSWIEFVKIKKKENTGKHLKEVLKMAGDEWKKVKAGSHSDYVVGKSPPMTRKKKSNKKKKKDNCHDDEVHMAKTGTRKSYKTNDCIGCKCCAKLKKDIESLTKRIEKLEN